MSVDGSEVARMGPGDHFGELALITEDARTATVTTATSLRCYVIAFWDFRKFAKENPDLMWKLLQHLAASSPPSVSDARAPRSSPADSPVDTCAGTLAVGPLA